MQGVLGGVGVNHYLLPPLPSLKEGGSLWNAYGGAPPALGFYNSLKNAGILANYGVEGCVVSAFFGVVVGYGGATLGLQGRCAIAKMPNIMPAVYAIGVHVLALVVKGGAEVVGIGREGKICLWL